MAEELDIVAKLKRALALAEADQIDGLGLVVLTKPGAEAEGEEGFTYHATRKPELDRMHKRIHGLFDAFHEAHGYGHGTGPVIVGDIKELFSILGLTPEGDEPPKH